MLWVVLYILRACVSRQLLIHNHKMGLTIFEIRVLLKHYWKQDYKGAAVTQRICQLQGEGECVAHRWFLRFNIGEENTF